MPSVIVDSEPQTIVQVIQEVTEIVQVITAGPQGAKGSTGDGMVTDPKIMKATTVTPSAWVAFEDYDCNNVVVNNSLDYSIDVRRGGAGDFYTMPALTSRSFAVVANSNEIAVRLTSPNDIAGLQIQAEAQTLA